MIQELVAPPTRQLPPLSALTSDYQFAKWLIRRYGADTALLQTFGTLRKTVEYALERRLQKIANG